MQPGLVDVPLLSDSLGSIGVVEGQDLLPFRVKRFYFIHGVPAGAVRGSHAHRLLHQLVVAVSGSVNVELDDGTTVERFALTSPGIGLRIPPGYWRTLTDFTPGSVVAVLASHEYDESDYIRDYDDFVSWSRRA
jgi:dTDP-4-dehydrorhamnose 3,5-epimerase-like enzyme